MRAAWVTSYVIRYNLPFQVLLIGTEQIETGFFLHASLVALLEQEQAYKVQLSKKRQMALRALTKIGNGTPSIESVWPCVLLLLFVQTNLSDALVQTETQQMCSGESDWPRSMGGSQVVVSVFYPAVLGVSPRRKKMV